jgi:myosin-5
MEDEDPQKLCVKFLDILLEEGSKPVVFENADGTISRANKIRMAQRQPEPMVFPKTDVQLGKTKVFMRKGPHDLLESHRVFHQNASSTLIQSWMKGMQQRRRYLIMEESALDIQRWYRGCMGRARWWRLREAQAGQLLTNNFRMQVVRIKYNRSRTGTIALQAQYRGRSTRRLIALTKIQAYRRMYICKNAFRKLRSASTAIQCCVRRSIAKKEFNEIKRAQKDMGKLKEHNEKLKMEMASLKAMLQAQAASDAGKEENRKAIEEKEKEVKQLETRVSQLERELANEKQFVQKLEKELEEQKENNRRTIQDLQYQKELVAKSQQVSEQTRKHSRAQSAGVPVAAEPIAEAVVVGHTITPEALAMHRAEVARLEAQLEEERKMRHAASREIKSLRSALEGKGDYDATASTKFISDTMSEVTESEVDRSDVANLNDVEPVEPELRYVTLVAFLACVCLNVLFLLRGLLDRESCFDEYCQEKLLHFGGDSFLRILLVPEDSLFQPSRYE